MYFTKSGKNFHTNKKMERAIPNGQTYFKSLEKTKKKALTNMI